MKKKTLLNLVIIILFFSISNSFAEEDNETLSDREFVTDRGGYSYTVESSDFKSIQEGNK